MRIFKAVVLGMLMLPAVAAGAGKSPRASFTVTPADPMQGAQVTFDASASRCWGSSQWRAQNCARYRWVDDGVDSTQDLLDSGTWDLGSGRVMTRSFEAAGRKNVWLVLTDAAGREGRTWKPVDVVAGPTRTQTEPPGFPAGYFTGPLGNNNVLPATTDGALFGVWSGLQGDVALQAAGFPGGAVGQRAYLVDHVADIGRTPDLIGSQIETYTANGVSNEDWIHNTFPGAVPVVTVGMGGGGALYMGYTPTQILAGSANATIDRQAQRYGSKPYRVMLAIGREFELHMDLTTTQAQANFRNAWIYIVNRFRTNGARNVGFMFSPGEQADGNGIRARQEAVYPGDNYVDWVGTSGYNQDRFGVWNTPLHDRWAEFREVFAYDQLGSPYASYYTDFGGRKPFIPGETGSLYSRDGIVDRKERWFRNIADVAEPNMPNLRGLIYFGQATTTTECRVDWRASSNATALNSFDNCANGGVHGTFDQRSWDGYRYLAHHPKWNVGVAP